MSKAIGTIAGGVGGFLIGGPTGAAIGASIGGGIDGSRAASDAASTLQQGADAATTEARREYDLTRADQLDLLKQQRTDQQPWLDAGKNALAKLASGVDLPTDPGYQFRLSEGEKAIQRAASGRGGLYSGATLKALARFNQDTASNEYGASWSRLAQIAGFGQNATNQVGQAGQSAYGTIANAGQNTSSAVQSNLTGSANARASGYVGNTNSITNGVGQALNFYQNQNLLSKLSKG